MWYKNTRVAKGSALYELLSKNDSESKRAAEKHFEKLDVEFKKRYPQCTKEWFAQINNRD